MADKRSSDTFHIITPYHETLFLFTEAVDHFGVRKCELRVTASQQASIYLAESELRLCAEAFIECADKLKAASERAAAEAAAEEFPYVDALPISELPKAPGFRFIGLALGVNDIGEPYWRGGVYHLTYKGPNDIRETAYNVRLSHERWLKITHWLPGVNLPQQKE